MITKFINILRAGAVAGFLVLGGGPALADAVATVADITGSVMVNQGENLVSVTPGMALEPGNQIMVLEGGSATIRYSNGCVIEVGELAQLPILEEGDCDALAAAAIPLTAAQAAALGAGGTAVLGAGLSTAAKIGIGIGAIAAIGAGIALGSGGGSPAPPPPISGQ